MAFFGTDITSPKPSPGMLPRVAIVGSGIAGLAAAHHLRGHAEITLLESGAYFGGHTHTVDMRLPNAQGQEIDFGVDTGFLVLNERTYPHLLGLFKTLGVEIAPSDMSFSVQVPEQRGQRRIEWSGSNLSTVFAQRRNLISPQFWGMLSDIVRFNRLCTDMAQQGLDRTDGPLMEPLGDFLQRECFGEAFKHWYFLPMMGCIWSCPTDQMLAFPVATMVRFCHNHGLIQIANRPQWYTVRGGARHYVDAITADISDKRLNTPVRGIVRDAQGAHVRTDAGTERFDHVVLACHSDQALTLLGEGASAAERAVLGAIPYQSNLAVLHTDTSVLPERRSAWAAWNYERAANAAQEQAQVCLHYWLNVLQPLPVEQAVVVSLNPQREIKEHHVVGRYEYAHPVFDLGAIQAQTQVPGLQGQQRTHFCGAWMGYGFHEDGLKAGMAAAASVRQALEVLA
jgi:predicted NAD/FAD-binding protein